MHLLLLLGLLVVSSLGPGFFFVRRLRLGPLEKLCVSLGLSLVFVYLASFASYLAAPGSAVPHYVTSGVCVALTLLSIADLRRLAAVRAVRRHLAAFGLLFLWSLGLACLVRHYSGGHWYGDWFEHYQRAEFFLGRLPHDYKFLTLYLLPARPPLMNLVDAHFLAQVGPSFAAHQVVYVFIGLLAFFPCALIARALVPRARRALVPLTVLFALNPMFVQNLTFTWPRPLTAFYVILGIWLYLAGWRKGDPWRMTAAFLSLSAGCLSHFSAGPYAVFLALHYVGFVFRHRRAKWRELGLIGVTSAALLGTWLAWSIAAYGTRATVASNTTVTDSSRASFAENLQHILTNLFRTLVPHPLRMSYGSFQVTLGPESPIGYFRDYVFLLYQVNVLPALGSVGGLLALYFMVRGIVSRPAAARPAMSRASLEWNDIATVASGNPGGAERRFWLMFLPFSIAVGIAVHPATYEFGLAHICLEPVVFIGLAFVAASLPGTSHGVRVLALIGLQVDLALGILLHYALQSIEFAPAARLGRLVVESPSGIQLSFVAVNNWVLKYTNKLTFLGDELGGYSTALVVSAALGGEIALLVAGRRLLGGRGKRTRSRARSG